MSNKYDKYDKIFVELEERLREVELEKYKLALHGIFNKYHYDKDLTDEENSKLRDLETKYKDVLRGTNYIWRIEQELNKRGE